jgi:transcriptional regulator with XRE-family HTH domain
MPDVRMGKSNIPELLHKRGKTQADLADYLDVTYGFVSQVVNGKSKISVINLKKIAIYLNVQMDDLFEWIVE